MLPGFAVVLPISGVVFRISAFIRVLHATGAAHIEPPRLPTITKAAFALLLSIDASPAPGFDLVAAAGLACYECDEQGFSHDPEQQSFHFVKDRAAPNVI